MTLQRIIAILLAAFMLWGCSRQQLPGSSSTPDTLSSSTESETSLIAAPDTELKTPGTIRLYRYFHEGEVYETTDTAYLGEKNFLAIINHITAALDIQNPLPILSITQQKGFVSINLDGSFIEDFSKGDIVTLLNSLTMTLFQNSTTMDSVQFQLNGEVGVFGETFNPAPLVFAPGDPAQFAAICASIPYERLQLSLPYYTGEIAKFAEPTDATAKEIALFLSSLGKIEKDAASSAELDQSDLFYSCIQATARYYSAPTNYFDGAENYRKELAPIADSVSAKLGMSEDMFWIADHVREMARLLCGDDFTLQLTEKICAPWEYFETEGVITPPHMGGGYSALPIVLSYEATANGYRVEAAYIYVGEGGYFIWGQGDTVIPENQLLDKAPRREIILKRADDGGLRFVSHRFL